MHMSDGLVGADGSGVIVEFVNTTGATIPGTTWANNTWRRFNVYKPLGDQALAILLTALSNKTKVMAYIGGTATPGSLVFRVGATQVPQ